MPLFKSSRKVQHFGSSLAITLPATFVKIQELEQASTLKVFYSLDGVLVVSCIDDEEVLSDCLVNLIDRLDEMKEEQNARAEVDKSSRYKTRSRRYARLEY